MRFRRDIRLLRPFPVMDHCGEFGYTLWATAANLVMRYGQRQQICFYVVGRCGGFGYMLWATAWNEAIQYKSVTSALWTKAPELVMRYGP